MAVDKFKTLGKDSFENIDYIVSCDLLKNYSGMRILALGGAITLLLSLISIERNISVLENTIQNILILLTNYVSIRVIGSINSNVYARCLHLEWLETKLNVIGFFTYWNKYVIAKSKNASSNAFILSCIGFNYIGSILVIVNSYVLIIKTSIPNFIGGNCTLLNSNCQIRYIKIFMIICTTLLAIFSFLINKKYIENNKTKNLIPKLKASLQKERASVKTSKIKMY
jgi:hypothetical protein